MPPCIFAAQRLNSARPISGCCISCREERGGRSGFCLPDIHQSDSPVFVGGWVLFGIEEIRSQWSGSYYLYQRLADYLPKRIVEAAWFCWKAGGAVKQYSSGAHGVLSTDWLLR